MLNEASFREANPFRCFSACSVVLLLNPDEDIPPEVQLASEQLSKACSSPRDIAITLILHSFQAVLGAKHDLQAVHTALEVKH